jgi:hypothetical protein
MLKTEKLLDEMHLQWRLAGGKLKDDKDSKDKNEIALAATNAKKGGKKSNGREKKENPNKDKTCNHCMNKGHIKNTCWEKFPDKRQEAKIDQESWGQAGKQNLHCNGSNRRGRINYSRLGNSRRKVCVS